MSCSVQIKTRNTVKPKKVNNVIHLTTSETLRLGEPDILINNTSRQILRAITPPLLKKSSCSFQITGVSLTQRADFGDDSADDLDESHTDDNSRVTDNETPSFSEDTYSRDIEDNYIESCSALCSVTVLPTTSEFELGSIALSDTCLDSSAISYDNTEQLEILGEDDFVMSDPPNTTTTTVGRRCPGTRFTIVKVETPIPFRRGRWECVDYFDNSIYTPKHALTYKSPTMDNPPAHYTMTPTTPRVTLTQNNISLGTNLTNTNIPLIQTSSNNLIYHSGDTLSNQSLQSHNVNRNLNHGDSSNATYSNAFQAPVCASQAAPNVQAQATDYNSQYRVFSTYVTHPQIRGQTTSYNSPFSNAVSSKISHVQVSGFYRQPLTRAQTSITCNSQYQVATSVYATQAQNRVRSPTQIQPQLQVRTALPQYQPSSSVYYAPATGALYSSEQPYSSYNLGYSQPPAQTSPITTRQYICSAQTPSVVYNPNQYSLATPQSPATPQHQVASFVTTAQGGVYCWQPQIPAQSVINTTQSLVIESQVNSSQYQSTPPVYCATVPSCVNCSQPQIRAQPVSNVTPSNFTVTNSQVQVSSQYQAASPNYCSPVPSSVYCSQPQIRAQPVSNATPSNFTVANSQVQVSSQYQAASPNYCSPVPSSVYCSQPQIRAQPVSNATLSNFTVANSQVQVSSQYQAASPNYCSPVPSSVYCSQPQIRAQPVSNATLSNFTVANSQVQVSSQYQAASPNYCSPVPSSVYCSQPQIRAQPVSNATPSNFTVANSQVQVSSQYQAASPNYCSPVPSSVYCSQPQIRAQPVSNATPSNFTVANSQVQVSSQYQAASPNYCSPVPSSVYCSQPQIRAQPVSNATPSNFTVANSQVQVSSQYQAASPNYCSPVPSSVYCSQPQIRAQPVSNATPSNFTVANSQVQVSSQYQAATPNYCSPVPSSVYCSQPQVRVQPTVSNATRSNLVRESQVLVSISNSPQYQAAHPVYCSVFCSPTQVEPQFSVTNVAPSQLHISNPPQPQPTASVYIPAQIPQSQVQTQHVTQFNVETSQPQIETHQTSICNTPTRGVLYRGQSIQEEPIIGVSPDTLYNNPRHSIQSQTADTFTIYRNPNYPTATSNSQAQPQNLPVVQSTPQFQVSLSESDGSNVPLHSATPLRYCRSSPEIGTNYSIPQNVNSFQSTTESSSQTPTPNVVIPTQSSIAFTSANQIYSINSTPIISPLPAYALAHQGGILYSNVLPQLQSLPYVPIYIPQPLHLTDLARYQIPTTETVATSTPLSRLTAQNFATQIKSMQLTQSVVFTTQSEINVHPETETCVEKIVVRSKPFHTTDPHHENMEWSTSVASQTDPRHPESSYMTPQQTQPLDYSTRAIEHFSQMRGNSVRNYSERQNQVRTPIVSAQVQSSIFSERPLTIDRSTGTVPQYVTPVPQYVTQVSQNVTQVSQNVTPVQVNQEEPRENLDRSVTSEDIVQNLSELPLPQEVFHVLTRLLTTMKTLHTTTQAYQRRYGLPDTTTIYTQDYLGTRSDYCEMAAATTQAASNTSALIDTKIEQAMDLVKSHLLYTVRQEVEVLKLRISELLTRINQLEQENSFLKANASSEVLVALNSRSEETNANDSSTVNMSVATPVTTTVTTTTASTTVP